MTDHRASTSERGAQNPVATAHGGAGAWLPSARQLLTYLAVVGLVLMASPYGPTFVVGFALAGAGILLRVWGCGHLRKNRQLTTSGPYAHVQHPLYLGTFLITVGAIMAAGSPRMPGLLVWIVVAPVFLLVFFGYYLPKKKRVEGRRLAERFPDEYGKYGAQVPAFLPSLRPFDGRSRAPWSREGFIANHEIGMDVLIVLLFALLWFAPRLRPWQ
jgi:protein-S-isoprenylcysteine O-methyltransferase Ste14